MKKILLTTAILLAFALVGVAQQSIRSNDCWDGTVAEAYAGGDGTAENPYQIASAEQMALLAEQTNNGTGGDAHYVLMDNICLNGSAGILWQPIGSSTHFFHGSFDGNNHIISDMVVDGFNAMYEGWGLFGWTNGANICNIRIDASRVKNASVMGLVVGYAVNTNVISCHVDGTVGNEGFFECNYVGGVVGYSQVEANAGTTYVIRGCVNHAKISSMYRCNDGGGIVGHTSMVQGGLMIEECRNYGDIISTNFGGGIVGEGDMVVKHCENYGKISTDGDGFGNLGGIVGGGGSNSIVAYCINHVSGEVEGFNVGGIIGAANRVFVVGCGNEAAVKGSASYYVMVGGIAGSEGCISNCYNHGDISYAAKQSLDRRYIQLGGITGSLGSEGYIYNVYNTGAVIYTPGSYCGIIVSCANGYDNIRNCYWFGEFDVQPCGNIADPLSGSCAIHEGATPTTWVLEEEQYGTTDFLTALNLGSMGECLWVEDVNETNGGFPIPVEQGSAYPLLGTEWYYEILNENGNITYQHLEYTSDTTINDKDVKIIIRTNTLYDKDSYVETTHEYIYQENDSVYWWNKDMGQFTLLYDFGAGEGDEWEIQVGTECITMHVDLVNEFIYYGTPFKSLTVSDEDDVFSGTILCGVGHLTSFFPERLMYNGEGARVVGLRCYWIGDELVFNTGDEDCDAIYIGLHGMEEKMVSDDFNIYPNPTHNVLIVETQNFASLIDRAYRITNVTGQTLQSGTITAETQQVDVSALPQGIYFITVGDNTRKFVLNK